MNMAARSHRPKMKEPIRMRELLALLQLRRVQTFHEQSRSVEEQKKIFSAAQLQGHASEDQHKREKPMFEGWKGRAMTLTP
ncbi:hypothetical protein M8J77_006034 [Diaphorina citri]|nr:hypothetical protein M8J77_006034 [Diaphorina citri]